MADCDRCGNEGATKTELRFRSGAVKHRLLDQPCRDKYNSDGYTPISEAIDLNPIDAVDAFQPSGLGICPACGKEYADVRRHQQRVPACDPRDTSE